MNKQAAKLYKTNKTEYLRWCKKNKKPSYKTETLKEFFNEKEKLKESENGNATN